MAKKQPHRRKTTGLPKGAEPEFAYLSDPRAWLGDDELRQLAKLSRAKGRTPGQVRKRLGDIFNSDNRTSVTALFSLEEKREFLDAILQVDKAYRFMSRQPRAATWKRAAKRLTSHQISKLVGLHGDAERALVELVKVAKSCGSPLRPSLRRRKKSGNVYFRQGLDVHFIPVVQEALESLRKARLPEIDQAFWDYANPGSIRFFRQLSAYNLFRFLKSRGVIRSVALKTIAEISHSLWKDKIDLREASSSSGPIVKRIIGCEKLLLPVKTLGGKRSVARR